LSKSTLELIIGSNLTEFDTDFRQEEPKRRHRHGFVFGRFDLVPRYGANKMPVGNMPPSCSPALVFPTTNTNIAEKRPLI